MLIKKVNPIKKLRNTCEYESKVEISVPNF